MERRSGTLQSAQVVHQELDTPPAEHSRTRPAPRGTAAYPRRRANKACQVCRARRTKCDNKRPCCSFCEKIGAKCYQSPTDLSSFDPASLLILERLEDLRQVIVSQKNLNSPGPLPSSPGGEVVRLNELDASAHSLGVLNFECVLSWPIFQHRFEDHLDIKSLLSKSEGPTSKSTALRLDETTLTHVGFDSCTRLLDIFLENVHVKNPVLDEAEVRGYIKQVSVRGLLWDAQSCLVLLICALGLIASPFRDSPHSTSMEGRQSRAFDEAEVYARAAQMRLGALFGQAGVLETQCFFFSGVYYMALQKPLVAWRLFVQAVASCRCFVFSDRVSNQNPEPLAAKESLYWTCLKSEFELRVELSLNGSGVGDLSYPSFFPSPPTETCKDQGRSWYFYLAEIALKRLINDAMRLQFVLQPTSRLFETTTIFEDQLAKWMHSLPSMLSLETSELDDDILKFILRGHLSKCQEVIYWPFLLDAVGNSHRESNADRYILRGLQTCVDRINENEPGFHHRHHGTWLMLRACSRSALTLLAARGCGQMPDLLPLGWKDAVEKCIEMLKFWREEIYDAAACLSILELLLNECAD